MTLHKPALIVHTFFPVAFPDAATSDPAVHKSAGPTGNTPAALWQSMAALGMTSPIHGRPVDLPDVRGAGSGPLELLAARQRDAPDALYEALAYRVHDVVGISVLLAPNDDDRGWQDLHAEWTSLARVPAGSPLGTAMVYLGLAPARRPYWLTRRTTSPQAWARRLRPHLPGTPEDPGWTDSWCRTADQLLMWELPAEEAGPDRRLIVTGDPGAEAAMDGWTWLCNGRLLPPLTRYLLHAARLRYQQRVVDTAIMRLRTAVAGTEKACDTLTDLLRTADPSAQQVQQAGRALTQLQAEQSLLITASADAADMAETVRAARQGMATALGPDTQCRPGGPVERDEATVAWLQEQLPIERTYAESACRRADQLGRLAAAVVDDRHRRRQENLTLFQASVLGSLLMALAAIQSLAYKVPLRGPLVAPLICVLAALALVLPAGVLHWPRRNGAAPRTGRFVAGAVVAGASVGWLATGVRWLLAHDLPAPPGWSITAALAGAAVSGLAAWALTAHARAEQTA